MARIHVLLSLTFLESILLTAFPTDKQLASHAASDISSVWKMTKFSGRYFGGISVHSNERIGKTQIIDANRPFITQNNVISPGFADLYSGGPKPAYRDIATQLSGAAGKLYVELCRCTGLQADDTPRAAHEDICGGLNHPEISVSGFWIQGSRFITCAHFLDVAALTAEEKQNTTYCLRWRASDASDRQKAVVSSEIMVTKLAMDAINPINVYLSQLDRDSDLAIFQAYNDGCSQPAPAGLLPHEITTLAQCDKSQGVYTVGYCGVDGDLQGITPYDDQVLNTFWPLDGEGDGARPSTYFPVKYAGVMQRRDDSVKFDDIFRYPNHRTISTGDIGEVVSTQQRSEFVVCQVTAWYQSSGGLVGGFVWRHDNGRAVVQPTVFGVFHGDLGPNNTMVAFTPAGRDWLFE